MSSESIPEAWEMLREYILTCPYYRMDYRLILQNFYNGLTPITCDHIDTLQVVPSSH
jgi:hypothetical protein